MQPPTSGDFGLLMIHFSMQVQPWLIHPLYTTIIKIRLMYTYYVLSYGLKVGPLISVKPLPGWLQTISIPNSL